MKLTKSLFLAFAGLGLFACSNEEVVDNGGIQGDANVVVGVDLANLRGSSSRAVSATEETPNGEKTPVKLNSVVLTLESQTGGTQTYNFSTELTGNPTSLTHTFDKVRNPIKISVSINGGASEELELKDIYDDGLAAPLYAETTNFGTADDSDGDGVLTYNVTLAPQHEIALLEFKGIQHEEHVSEGCLFSSLKFDGMFLNGVKLHETTSGYATFSDWTAAQNNDAAPTFTVINESFLKANAATPVFPSESGKCYAYNIFPEEETNMPKLTLCFSDVTLNSGQAIAGWSTGNPLYAAVSKYKLTGIAEENGQVSPENQTKYGVDADGYLTKFMAGYVYKFKDLVVPDEAFGPTPEGGEDAQVIATVTITEWNIVNGTVEW